AARLMLRSSAKVRVMGGTAMAETEAGEGTRATTGRARGGRPARPAPRPRARGAPPVITRLPRALPTYELMSEEGLVRIEEAADPLRQEIGLDIGGDERCLELWRDAGADVQGERVRFPKGLVADIIRRNVPSSFIHHARNPARSVTVGG